jgi:hypothetical protein
LTDFQSKFNKISDADARAILVSGANSARAIANKKMLQIKKAIGIA